MSLRPLPLLACLAVPAHAGDLKCPTEMFCSDARCIAADPANDEAAHYVRDADGTAPELYLGDGIWVAAIRSQDRGTAVFTATSPQGEAVFLGLRQSGGAYILTRREPGPQGRVWTATGRCKDQ